MKRDTVQSYFVIDHPHIVTIEEATVAEAVQFQNWCDTPNGPSCALLCCPDPNMLESIIQKNGIDHVVPVGSVEFVSRFCQAHGIPVLTAVNIPPELEEDKYLGRRVWRDLTPSGLLKLPSGQKYLIKPGKTIKRFEMKLYKPGITNTDGLQLPEKEPLFVSEYLQQDVVSEWRLFVRHGIILDAKPYYLKQWTVPDSKLCAEMAGHIKKYPAMTLDVAVLKDHSTVVIEAHEFMACGFYGLEGPDVLTLLRLAWKHQCSKGM